MTLVKMLPQLWVGFEYKAFAKKVPDSDLSQGKATDRHRPTGRWTMVDIACLLLMLLKHFPTNIEVRTTLYCK